MPSKQRYVVVSIAGLALLGGMALAHGLQWLWGEMAWADPLPLGVRELPLTALLAYGSALAVGLGLLRHPTSHGLATEIVDELSRVSWPNRRETAG